MPKLTKGSLGIVSNLFKDKCWGDFKITVGKRELKGDALSIVVVGVLSEYLSKETNDDITNLPLERILAEVLNKLQASQSPDKKRGLPSRSPKISKEDIGQLRLKLVNALNEANHELMIQERRAANEVEAERRVRDSVMKIPDDPDSQSASVNPPKWNPTIPPLRRAALTAAASSARNQADDEMDMVLTGRGTPRSRAASRPATPRVGGGASSATGGQIYMDASQIDEFRTAMTAARQQYDELGKTHEFYERFIKRSKKVLQGAIKRQERLSTSIKPTGHEEGATPPIDSEELIGAHTYNEWMHLYVARDEGEFDFHRFQEWVIGEVEKQAGIDLRSAEYQAIKEAQLNPPTPDHSLSSSSSGSEEDSLGFLDEEEAEVAAIASRQATGLQMKLHLEASEEDELNTADRNTLDEGVLTDALDEKRAMMAEHSKPMEDAKVNAANETSTDDNDEDAAASPSNNL